jgi:hypothetical protein
VDARKSDCHGSEKTVRVGKALAGAMIAISWIVRSVSNTGIDLI